MLLGGKDPKIFPKLSYSTVDGSEIRRENHRWSIKPYGKTCFFSPYQKELFLWTFFLRPEIEIAAVFRHQHQAAQRKDPRRLVEIWASFWSAKGMESAHEWTYLKRSQKKNVKKQHGRKNSMVSSLLKSREPQTLEVAYFSAWSPYIWRHSLWRRFKKLSTEPLIFLTGMTLLWLALLYDWYDYTLTTLWLHYD